MLKSLTLCVDCKTFTYEYVIFSLQTEYRHDRDLSPSSYLAHLRMSDFQRSEFASIQLKNEQLQAEVGAFVS